jgi:hypothetical protein
MRDTWGLQRKLKKHLDFLENDSDGFRNSLVPEGTSKKDSQELVKLQ